MNWSKMTDYKAGTGMRSEYTIKILHETNQQNIAQYS